MQKKVFVNLLSLIAVLITAFGGPFSASEPEDSTIVPLGMVLDCEIGVVINNLSPDVIIVNREYLAFSAGSQLELTYMVVGSNWEVKSRGQMVISRRFTGSIVVEKDESCKVRRPLSGSNG